MSRPKVFQELIQAIKLTLKTRRMTYAALAERIGVTESAVKKIFTGDDCAFGRLEQICDVLDVNIGDMLVALKSRSAKKFRLTAAQDLLFATEREAFALYWRVVYERQTLAIAQAEMRLSDQRTHYLLQQLDRVNLLKILPGGALKIPSIKLIEWELGPEFMRHYGQPWALKTFEDAQIAAPDNKFMVQYFQLLPDSAAEFRGALKELEAEYARRTVREMNLNRAGELIRFRFVAALAGGSFV